MRHRYTFAPLLFLASITAACGGSSADDGGDDDVQVDAAPTPTFQFATMCQRIAGDVASCASFDQATCVTVLQRGADRGCANWLDDLQTWVLDHRPAYQCVTVPGLGTQPMISPAAPENAVIGDACSGAVAKDACYGISCNSSLDCQSGWHCDDATGHCFDNTAVCAGMPCDSSLDCPTGEVCSDPQGVCIKS